MAGCWPPTLSLLVGIVIGVHLLHSKSCDGGEVVLTTRLAPRRVPSGRTDMRLKNGPAKALSSPAYTTAPRRCAILVDRHVHKTGGTTMRDIMLENERRGEWLYWGYSLGRLTPVFDELRKQAVSGNTTHRIGLEYHHGFIPFSPDVVDQLRSLRATYHALDIDCRVVLVTRVREPLSFYISYFKWAAAWRQKKEPATFGRNFTEWAPPNLQSALMLNSMDHMWAEKGIGHKRRREAFDGFDAHAWQRLHDLLLHFDIVGTTERFDETLLLTAGMTGLQHLRYHVNSPTRNSKWKRGVADAEVCPDLDACRRHVERIAPYDVQLYAESTQRLDRLVHDAGESFQRRLALFRAEEAEHRAHRQQMLRCRYWPVQPSRYNRSHHDCGHLAQKDLCALVYANRELRCPWHRVASVSPSVWGTA